jgi:hypothetical protein
VLDALESKPVIMGHSFGGAFVQLLLDAGYGAAGVSIDGAAVKGVRTMASRDASRPADWLPD